MTNHYVDNKKFYSAIVEYREKRQQCIDQGKEIPIIPNYIGQCITLIANKLATSPNFNNYPYIEEMIADGIENCITYFDNFNPEKWDNPFAYFTQIIYYAFVRRIQKEKKQLYVKYKTYNNMALTEGLYDVQEIDSQDFIDISVFENEKVNDFIKSFETNLEKKKKTVKNNLNKFFEKLEDENSVNN